MTREFDFSGDDAVVAKCFLLWAVLGAISLEVFGGYWPGTLTEPGALFDVQIRQLLMVLTPCADIAAEFGK